jgi:lipopolysaccharide/colanic/teichoic acid biosynthesis glycosyltransferase
MPSGKERGVYRTWGKGLFDILGAAAGIALLWPLMAAIALLIRWRMGAPVTFRQPRPGLHGRPFLLRKFRTMRPGPGPDAARIAPLGRVLRVLSLDELPELFHVLRGEMSLVGPRPLRMAYLAHYTPEQARRHEARPGITGWAQVHGRNAQRWDERFRYDLWYVDHCSLGLDLRILAMTVRDVVCCRGIRAEGHATMPPFTGLANGEPPAAGGDGAPNTGSPPAD